MEFILGGNTERKDLFPVIFCIVGRSPIFTKITTATSDEPSTYQELAVTLPTTELPYLNTTLK